MKLFINEELRSFPFQFQNLKSVSHLMQMQLIQKLEL